MDELLILARNGEFYRFPKDEFGDKRRLPTSMSYQVGLLVEQGVVLADVPLGSIPGEGLMCFLLNLSAIQRRPESEPKPSVTRTAPSPAPRGGEGSAASDPAMIDDLVVRFLGDEDFYWVRRSEYQKEEYRLTQLPEQLSALMDEGVLLATVPEKSITGLESGFCLVNLRDILRPEAKLDVEKRLMKKKELRAMAKQMEIPVEQEAEGQTP